MVKLHRTPQPYGAHATAPSYQRERRQRQAAATKAERLCIVPYCPRRPKLVTLPLSERRVWACDSHRGGLMIGAMNGVIAHG